MSLLYAVLATLGTFFALSVVAPEYRDEENAKQATGEAVMAALCVGAIVFFALAVGS